MNENVEALEAAVAPPVIAEVPPKLNTAFASSVEPGELVAPNATLDAVCCPLNILVVLVSARPGIVAAVVNALLDVPPSFAAGVALEVQKLKPPAGVPLRFELLLEVLKLVGNLKLSVNDDWIVFVAGETAATNENPTELAVVVVPPTNGANDVLPVAPFAGFDSDGCVTPNLKVSVGV